MQFRQQPEEGWTQVNFHNRVWLSVGWLISEAEEGNKIDRLRMISSVINIWSNR